MKNTRYRILVIGLSYKRAGVESYILNMTRMFSSEQIELYFITNGAEKTYGQELQAMGHRFITVPQGRGIHFIAFYKEWSRIFRQYQFHAVYLNDCTIVQVDILRLAKWHRVPVRIFHAHSSSWRGSVPPPLHHKMMAAWNKKNIADISTLRLSCSKEAADWMFPPECPYTIIPNAIDIQKNTWSSQKREAFREKLNLSHTPLVGFIGRFAPEKNVVHFIHSFAELKQQIPQIVALLVGDGVQRPDIESAIKELQLPEGSIRLLGERHDISYIMSALDCLVMPSVVEGFPYTLVEAQTHGLPCVVSDRVSRHTDLTGLLRFVPLENQSEWVSAISSFIHSNTNRITYADKMRKQGYDAHDVFSNLQKRIIDGITSQYNVW